MTGPQADGKVHPDFMIERATEGLSVALFRCPLEFKDQNKTVEVARQQLHFFRDQENQIKANSEPGGRAPRLRLTLLLAQKSKQKRASAALGMSGSSGRQLQFRQDDQTKSLHVPRRTRGS